MSLCADRMSPAHRTVWRCLLLCAWCLVSSGRAAAEEPTERGYQRTTAAGLSLPPRGNGSPTGTSPRTKTSSNSSGLWTTVIALAAIVGTLTLAGRWLKPYLGASRGLPIEALELLGRRQIEPKVAVHLVRCGGKVLVLGVSAEGVRTLSEIVDPQEVARLTEACLDQNSRRDSVSKVSAPAQTLANDVRTAIYSSNEESRHA